MFKIWIGLLYGISLFAADIQVASYDNVKLMVKNSPKYSVVILHRSLPVLQNYDGIREKIRSKI